MNAKVPEGIKIYIRQPTGFETQPSMVCLLKKALYGLRKAPLWWFETVCDALKKYDFEPLDAECCIFKNETLKVLLIIYVDDLCIASADEAMINHVKDLLAELFALKCMGPVHEFLGMRVTRDRERGLLWLSQEGYIEKIIEKFHYQDLSPVKTPFNTSAPSWPLPYEYEPMMDHRTEYLSKSGSVNYVSSGTRPDITYIVSRLCEGNARPGKHHFAAMKHLFRYLIGIKGLAIVIGGMTSPGLHLHCYSDASLADVIGTRQSTGGYIVFIAGAPIHWKSGKQTMVVLLSTEVEFINLTPSGVALLWLARFL